MHAFAVRPSPGVPKPFDSYREGPQCPRNGLTKRLRGGSGGGRDRPRYGSRRDVEASEPRDTQGLRIRSRSGFAANTAEGGCATERGGEEL
jgi:hypothetical protein